MKQLLILVLLLAYGMHAQGQTADELKDRIDDSLTTVTAPRTIRATNLGERMKEIVDFADSKADTSEVYTKDEVDALIAAIPVGAIFDVDNYGAIPNDGLDDSGPIQAAKNAAAANPGGGYVVGLGVYTLRNEPDRAIELPWNPSSTYVQSGQLYLPLRRARDCGRAVVMKPRYPVSIPRNLGTPDSNMAVPKVGFVIKSYETNYSSGDRMLMAAGTIQSNANILVLQDMMLLLDNRNGIGARMGIVDATVGNLVATNCFFGVDTTIQAIPYPTNTNNVGVRGANTLDSAANNTYAKIENCVAYGLTTGFRLSANTYANNNISWGCNNGLIGTVNSGHGALIIPAHTSKYCRVDFSGLTHPFTDSCSFNIGLLNADVYEDTTKWYGNRYTISDGNDVLKGTVVYNITKGGQQHNELYRKTGGTRVRAYAFGTAFEPEITAATTSDYYRGDKTFQPLTKAAVGLDNADNTSDAEKPVSTATSTALGLKWSINGNALGGVSSWFGSTDNSEIGIRVNSLSRMLFRTNGTTHIGDILFGTTANSGNVLTINDGSTVNLNLKNTATGGTNTDGLRLTVDGTTAKARIIQFENAALGLSTNNAERILIGADGIITITSPPEYENNAAAAASQPVGTFYYRTGHGLDIVR